MNAPSRNHVTVSGRPGAQVVTPARVSAEDIEEPPEPLQATRPIPPNATGRRPRQAGPQESAAAVAASAGARR
ncbi:hypothetical protein GT039_39505 [Streptomyces sp. SID2955]|nr:hypothetical protein [Streptomyces sp. SID2955]